jgi:hypothetical protein
LPHQKREEGKRSLSADDSKLHLDRPRAAAVDARRRSLFVLASGKPAGCLCLPRTCAEERSMREFGVRRYGDSLYHHCMADSAADAANWFAHFQTGIEGKDFQALVKDVARPVTDEAGVGGNPEVVMVRHGPLTPGGKAATDLKRTSSLR